MSQCAGKVHVTTHLVHLDFQMSKYIHLVAEYCIITVGTEHSGQQAAIVQTVQ